MRRIRPVVVGLLMLWLPLQAIAAVSMPFCTHGIAAGAGVAPSAEHHHHAQSGPASGAHAGHGEHHAPAADDLQPCNNCGACNLACAPAVPVAGVQITALSIAVQPAFSRQFSALFIPEQPQPPPNTLL